MRLGAQTPPFHPDRPVVLTFFTGFPGFLGSALLGIAVLLGQSLRKDPTA